MSARGAVVSLALPGHEGRLLASHLDRLASWDASGSVRIVARGSAVGVYAAPPMRVLSFVALPLTEPLSEGIDVTVTVPGARAGITSDSSVALLRMPEPVLGDPALAVLPLSEGWHLPIHGVSGDVIPEVDAAPARAEQMWERNSFGGLPLRVLHAARRLGFLTDDASRITASTTTGWKRLTTVRGQVFVRTVPPTQRPGLSVVR